MANLTLLHSEQQKLHRVLAVLSAVGLKLAILSVIGLKLVILSAIELLKIHKCCQKCCLIPFSLYLNRYRIAINMEGLNDDSNDKKAINLEQPKL